MGFADDVRRGLTDRPKHLPCGWFYDREGSQLFEQICALPEYYLTRADDEILRARAPELAARFSEGATVVELGSGSAVKTRHVLEALLARQPALRYVPIDVSTTALAESGRALRADYPGLTVDAVAGDWERAVDWLAADSGAPPRLVLWLGSNIGNLTRREAAAFLGRMRASLRPRDRALVGIDLRKDRATLEAAYDDAAGVTARFNRNLLARVNRELGGRFDLERFRHRAVYDEADGRISLHLVSTAAQRVVVDALGLEVAFEAGEAIHTEDSYKYGFEEIEALAAAAGLAIEAQWTDAAGRFSETLFRRP